MVGETRNKRKFDCNEGIKFEEYLGVMQPPNKANRLANERNATTQKTTVTRTIDADQKFKEGRSDEECITAQDAKHPRILFGSPAHAARGRDLSVPLPREPSHADFHTLETAQGEKITDQLKPAASDEEWRRSRTARTLDLVVYGGDDGAVSISATPTSPANSRSSVPPPEHAMVKWTSNASVQTDTGHLCKVQVENDLLGQDKENSHTRRLFVRNLPYSITEDEIRRVFECRNHGMIEEVSLTKQSHKFSQIVKFS